MRPYIALLVLLVVLGCRGRIPLPAGEESADFSPAIPMALTLDPYPILNQMVAAYQSATAYSDRAAIQMIGKVSHPDAEPAPRNCMVILHKPNQLSLDIADGMLISDGVNCVAQVRSLPYQVLRFPAPERWTLETLFQDVHLDDAMKLELPPSVIRFPPQLVLLLANDPINTFCPKDARVEWLGVQQIDQMECDMIQVSHSDGNRILWISRENHALLRLDYQPVGLPIPEGFDSIDAIRIEITDARFDGNNIPNTWQMQTPPGARYVSEFYSNTPGIPSPVEHRHQLRMMADSDCYRIVDQHGSSATPPEQQPTKVAPKTFTLAKVWSQHLAGADSIALVADEPPKLLIPYEGNLVAVLDMQGNVLNRVSPEGLSETVIMNIRSNLLTGKRRIGITTLDGKFHLFDESFTPLPIADLETDRVGEFRFVPYRDEELLLLSMEHDFPQDVAAAAGKVHALDLQGAILWDYSFEGILDQIASATLDGQNRVLLSCSAPYSSIIVLSPDGKAASNPVSIPFGRHVIWFHVLDSTIYTLLEDTSTGNVRFAGLDKRGEAQWSRLLPSGEYEVEPVYVPSERKWLVPSPGGAIHVFDQIGNMIDQFSLDVLPAGLLCVQVDGDTLLIVADGETVSAWKIGKCP